jgi:hypothetical protein
MSFTSKAMIVIAVLCIGSMLWAYFTDQLPGPLPKFHTASNTKPGVTTTTNSAVPSGITTTAYPASQPFDFGAAQYTLGKISVSGDDLRSGTLTATTSGSFVLVDLTVLDRGSAPLVLDAADFTLYDSKGNLYTVNENATNIASLSTANRKNLLTEPLQPGLSRDGIIVFEVPKDASGFTLRVANGYVDISLGK